MTAPVLVLGALAVAAANGANDNFKGVATLFGSRTASYRTSLAWGTLTTLAGSLAAAFLGARLASAFSGDGILPAGIVAAPSLMAAVSIGAALTVAAAARAGLPVSTTHAILGALPVSMTHVGVGSLAGLGWSAGAARWDTLRTIVLSWILTLPRAAALGAATFVIAERTVS